MAPEMVRQLNEVDACPFVHAASRIARVDWSPGFRTSHVGTLLRMVCDLPHTMPMSLSQEATVVGNMRLNRVLSASSVAG